jgi:peptidylprolyl isomerase
MRHFLRTAAGAAILLCLAVGTAAADDVIANLGQQPVKAADIKNIIDGLNPEQREQAARDPKFAVQVVRTAIARKILVEKADSEAWDKKPDVATILARTRFQVIYETYLQSVAPPPPNFPSEEEERAAFNANHERFFQYHLSQIYIAEPPASTAEQVVAIEKKARDLAKRAKAKGADFAALARENSQDADSAQKGGDLGWLAQSQLLPEIFGAVMATPDKGVSEPIHAGGGWHIIMVTGVKPADFAQVRDQIANALRQSRAVQVQQAYVEKLLNDRQLTINETAAAALFQAKK